MQRKYRIENAQTCGTCEIQSNYFSTVIEDSVFAVLADGSADHMNGRRAAAIAAQVSTEEFHGLSADVDKFEFFDYLTSQIIKHIKEIIYLGTRTNLSISFTCID